MDFEKQFEAVRYKNRLISRLVNLFSIFSLGSRCLSSRQAVKLLRKLNIKSTTEEVRCLIQNQKIDFIRFLFLFDTQNCQLIIQTIEDYMNNKNPIFYGRNFKYYFLFHKPERYFYKFYKNIKNKKFFDSVIDKLSHRDLNMEILRNDVLIDLIINHVKP